MAATLVRSGPGKRVIVAGATGSVGQLIVRALVADPRVEQVTAVVRHKMVAPDRAQSLWNTTADAGKLSQLVVDYEDLLKTSGQQDAEIQKAFENHDAFLTGLGVYSGSVQNEEEMDRVESCSVLLGTLAAGVDVPKGAYLSGNGVKQPTLEGRASTMFARSKGRSEEALAALFPAGHVSARPGAIFDRPGPPAYGFIDGYLMKTPLLSWIKDTSVGISAVDIAKGMVQGALFDETSTVSGNVIWENNAIKEAARRYEANLGEQV